MARATGVRTFWIGLALVVIGLIGGILIPALVSWAPRTDARLQEEFSSLGERIYLTGTGEDGEFIPRDTTTMHFASCADCHGQDGRGGVVSTMMVRFEAPDIRWSRLSSAHQDSEGEEHVPYTAEGFARALREGIEPDGEELEPPMPTWDLTEEQMDALIGYLRSL